MLQSSVCDFPLIVFEVQNSRLDVNVKPWANIGMYGWNSIPGESSFLIKTQQETLDPVPRSSNLRSSSTSTFNMSKGP